MKRAHRHLCCWTISALFAIVNLSANAQNIQVHYDFGHLLYDDLSGRPEVTTTLEMFKPDKLGSTYLFTDIDYYGDGAAGAYWEFSHEFCLPKHRQWALHLEYDGGMTTLKHTAVASRFQHAILGGGAWNWASKDLSKTFSLQLMYKQYFKGMGRKAFSGFQGTMVWSDTFAKGHCTFSGFADLWYDKDVQGKLIFLSEPQFWFNFAALERMRNIHLSIGTEVELSNNFVFNTAGKNDKFYVNPTLAVKWAF